MKQFLQRLENLGLGLGDEDIADLVWLAMQIGSVTAEPTSNLDEIGSDQDEAEPNRSNQTLTLEQASPQTAPQRQSSPTVSAFAADSVSRPPESETSPTGLPFQAPAVTALPNALELGRSLRPLMRKVPSATQFELDSEATVNRVIEQQIWQPVLRPAPERWLDLELVIEESPLSLVWRRTLDELKQKVLERSGVFRNVRSWTLGDRDGKPQLVSRYAGEIGARIGQPQELVHPSGRRLVMVISDGQSELWQSSQLEPDVDTWQSEQPAANLHAWLHYWAIHGPLVMVDLLPKWMWEQSGLEFGTPTQLMSIFPGAANQQWEAIGLSSRQRRRIDADVAPVLKLPIVTLDAESFLTWATVVAAAGITPTSGFVFNLSNLKQYQQNAKATPSRLREISDAALLDRFLATASPTAQQLAGMMAAVPVSVPVIHLLQAHFLPKSTPVHVAEVFMSGLLHQTGTNQKTQQPIYDFKTKEVRQLLNQAFPDYKTNEVVNVLSEAIGKRLGREDLNSFAAFLSIEPEVLEQGDDEERTVQRFAEVLPEVLRNLGGAYATLADTAELLARNPRLPISYSYIDDLHINFLTDRQRDGGSEKNIPELENFDYVTPVISFEDEDENDRLNDIGLISEVKTVEMATISISSSISEQEAFSALEENISAIKQKIIEDFEGQQLEFRLNRPEGAQVENIDESQILLSGNYKPNVEILDTEIEALSEDSAEFMLSVRISFAVEVASFNLDNSSSIAAGSKHGGEYTVGLNDGSSEVSEEDLQTDSEVTAQTLVEEWTHQTTDGRAWVSLNFAEDDSTDTSINFVELELYLPIELTEPDRSPLALDLPEPDRLESFEIQIKTIERVEGEWIARTKTGTALRYIEHLSESVVLEMVAIPGGEFEMGSPEDEPERNDNESPQHAVTLPGFFMGRYPVTQAQWRVVAALPPIARELIPEPSRFKGDNRPVEQVSWDDAIEFCARLSICTGRHYRLPSEAEWEYACRAGTTTPFHFGELITTKAANYNGRDYAGESREEGRGQTTPVTEFGIANRFGLSDMHGNVFEWCLDHWYGNYEGAPIDGSAWLSENELADRIYRGGAWVSYPWNCRSAYRLHHFPGYRYDVIGFRVVSESSV